MQLIVFTIFDSASGAYLRPFFQRSNGEALRTFENECVAAESPIANHPEDYSLYRIGTYDDNKGELYPEDRFCLATAAEVVASSRQIAPGSLKELNGESDAQSVGDGA